MRKASVSRSIVSSTACVAAVLAASLLASAALAQTLSYPDNPAGFLAASGATSLGEPQAIGLTTNPIALGIATFTRGPTATNHAFGNYTPELPGLDYTLSGSENFDISFSSSVHAFGFSMHEPAYSTSTTGNLGCNATCFNSPTRIALFAGSIELASFVYDAPDDVAAASGGPTGFFGVTSIVGFDRVQVRDQSSTIDNEYFGSFLVGVSPVPEPHAALMGLAGLALLVGARRVRHGRGAMPGA